MIWCFGDSNTEGYNLDFDWVQEYTEFKGYTPKWWTYHLSEMSNIPLINRGKGGTEMIYKPLNAGGVENALNQKGSIGWKMYCGAKILNELCNGISICLRLRIEGEVHFSCWHYSGLFLSINSSIAIFNIFALFVRCATEPYVAQ